MAKFFKSIFHTTDRRKAGHYNEHADADEDKSDLPPVPKRQMSISRSGRMRQANKKRHSLTLELYGDIARSNTAALTIRAAIQVDVVDKQQPMEYHVNAPSHTAPAVLGPRKSRFGSTEPEEVKSKDMISDEFSTNDVVPLQKKLSTVAIDLTEAKSLETEIDLAFEILDKS